MNNWYTLENKTCYTCKHEDYFIDDDYDYNQNKTIYFWIRACKKDDVCQDLINDINENLPDHYIHIQPAINCPCWEWGDPKDKRVT
jgi:hypothetical protein